MIFFSCLSFFPHLYFWMDFYYKAFFLKLEKNLLSKALFKKGPFLKQAFSNRGLLYYFLFMYLIQINGLCWILECYTIIFIFFHCFDEIQSFFYYFFLISSFNIDYESSTISFFSRFVLLVIVYTLLYEYHIYSSLNSVISSFLHSTLLKDYWFQHDLLICWLILFFSIYLFELVY